MAAESTLQLDGEIDFDSVPAWSALITDRLSARPAVLVLDLGHVQFMDSSALGMLVAAHSTCKKQSTVLQIRNVPPQIHRVFTVSGLDGLFDLPAGT